MLINKPLIKSYRCGFRRYTSNVSLGICLFCLFCLSAGGVWAQSVTIEEGETSGLNTLRPNVYGPGIHQNRYGQPVTLVPQGGGVYGESLSIEPNAYGPGIHMDQYGRKVREKKW